MTETLIQETNDSGSPLAADDRVTRWLPVGLFGICLAFSLWSIRVGWYNSILDMHSFRQTQTAISVHSLEEGASIFAYETPVLGPPWSIPIELPIYQSLVAELRHISDAALEQRGRFISALLFYATLFPLYFCLGAFNVRRVHRTVILGLFAASPFYIFWSRCFMIESTALFLSMTYLALVLRVLKGRSHRYALLWLYAAIAIAGGLAGTVKVTTYAGILIAAICAILWDYWKSDRYIRRFRNSIIFMIPSCLIPILLTVSWTRYSDYIKSQNPMASWLRSSELTSWTFGTLGQRFTFSNYSHFRSAAEMILGNGLVLLIACICLVFISTRRRIQFLFCMALWASVILMFFNLHYIHEYYAYANGVFLLAGIGIVGIGLLERKKTGSWTGLYFLVFCMGAFIAQYFTAVYPVQQLNARGKSRVADIIRRDTQPNEVLLISGLDWDPELPYLARRRAIMDRGELVPNAALKSTLSQSSKFKLGAIVICGSAKEHDDRIQSLLRNLSFRGTVSASASGCDIYLR
jgi:hypothetical protein